LATAQHGTLFLDEVGELPKELQARVLRALKEKTLDAPHGSTPFDVRVIAASNRHVDQMAREGTFLEELYYCLNVIPIEMPPLRERREDISLLADHFRRRANAREGRNVPAFAPEILERLCSYDWPGNVRQLQSTVDRLIANARLRDVCLSDLPANLRTDVIDLGANMLDLPPSGLDLRLLLTQLEDRLIGQALQRTNGNKNRAAELLGMNRTTLVEKLRRRNVA
jgi:DNA-binding NtrC family response regulator